MANYTNGTATISGSRETIRKLQEALSLLDEASSIQLDMMPMLTSCRIFSKAERLSS